MCGGRDDSAPILWIECYQIPDDRWTVLSIKLDFLFAECRCFSVLPHTILILGYR